MNKKPAVIESMSTFTREFAGTVEDSTPGWLIRVWRNETEVRPCYNNEDIEHVVHIHDNYDQSDLAMKILQLDRVNAVEVKDAHGDGIVLYSEWP